MVSSSIQWTELTWSASRMASIATSSNSLPGVATRMSAMLMAWLLRLPPTNRVVIGILD